MTKKGPSAYQFLFTVPRPAIREWAAGISPVLLERRALQIESTIDSIRLRIEGEESNPLFNDEALLLDKMEDVLTILEVEIALRNFMEEK